MRMMRAMQRNRCVTDKVDILCGEFRAGEIFGEEPRKGGVHQETKCGIMSHEVMKQDVMQWHSRFSYFLRRSLFSYSGATSGLLFSLPSHHYTPHAIPANRPTASSTMTLTKIVSWPRGG